MFKIIFEIVLYICYAAMQNVVLVNKVREGLTLSNPG